MNATKKLTKPMLAALSELAAIRGPIHQYDDAAERRKLAMHKQGLVLARAIAKLYPGTKVRSNMGGIAVSGEVYMHGDNVWFQISQSLGGVALMWRRPKNARDSVRWDADGQNRYIDLSDNAAQVQSQIEEMLSYFDKWSAA